MWNPDPMKKLEMQQLIVLYLMSSNELIYQIQNANDPLHDFSDRSDDENYEDGNSDNYERDMDNFETKKYLKKTMMMATINSQNSLKMKPWML